MKKNRSIVILAIVLAIIAIILFFTSKNGTIKKELKDFAVKDTASIDKIFLADKAGKQITLTREPGRGWVLNGKYTARRDAIRTLLNTIANLEVQSPVAKAAYNNIIRDLAAGAIKVEIYQHGELSKTYYVGGTTQDQTGTFMLLENSNTPFIMQMAGFQGYLTTRYFTSEVEWRERLMFSYNPREITHISLTYPFKKEDSFVIERKDSTYIFKNAEGKEQAADQRLLISYIIGFKQLYLENYLNLPKKDSVLAATPIAIIEVSDEKGKKNLLKLYKKPNENQMMSADGKLYQYDPERMYGELNNSREIILIQNFAADKLLKNPEMILHPKH